MRDIIRALLATCTLLLCAPSMAEENRATAAPGGEPLPGKVIAGGQPDAGRLGELSRAGLAAVINLRTVGEDAGYDEAQLLREADVAYYQIPVAGSAGLSRSNVERLDALLARHAGQPVLVHCASGNRVGALMALRAHWLQGQDADSALQTGREHGLTGLEAAVREQLAGE